MCTCLSSRSNERCTSVSQCDEPFFVGSGISFWLTRQWLVPCSTIVNHLQSCHLENIFQTMQGSTILYPTFHCNSVACHHLEANRGNAAVQSLELIGEAPRNHNSLRHPPAIKHGNWKSRFNRKMVELNGSIIGGLSIAMVDYQNVQRGKLNPTHTFLSFLWLLAFLGKGITMDPNFNPPTSSMPPWSPRSPTLPPTCAPRICPKSSLARDSREP